MKKYIALLFTVLAFVLTGCEKETEPGGTAVEKMAGDWWVTVSVDGEVIAGPLKIFTYNTATNVPTEMWLDDEKGFWDFKIKVTSDANNMTFSTSDFVENMKYESKVKVANGKVTPGGAKSPSGMAVDGIHLEVSFDDDGDPTTVYVMEGFRRTGFPADDF